MPKKFYFLCGIVGIIFCLTLFHLIEMVLYEKKYALYHRSWGFDSLKERDAGFFCLEKKPRSCGQVIDSGKILEIKWEHYPREFFQYNPVSQLYIDMRLK